MPAKNKRNGLSHKQRNEANPVAYTSSLLSQLNDTSATSAASSPREHTLAFNPDFDTSSTDPEPQVIRETMSDHPDFPDGPLRCTEGGPRYRGEDEPVDTSNPASPPSQLPHELIVEEENVRMHVLDPQGYGHVRSPILAREPSTLESFSRALRAYVPSSITIPSAVPTPPLVSRPVSFGSFLKPSRASSSSAHRRGSDLDGTGWKRRGSDASLDHKRTMIWAEKSWAAEEVDQAVFNLDEDHEQDRLSTLRPTPTTYPTTDLGEEIVCATFGMVVDKNVPRRLMMLGYQTGLQIWDCSNLGSVCEVLNLTEQNAVEAIGVLPDPNPDLDDAFRGHRPLIGFLSRAGNRTLVIYSLRTHEVIKTLNPPSLVSFSASTDFIILSTSEPASLHILSSRTLRTLYTLPTAVLTPFAHPSPSTDIHTSVSLSTVEHDGGSSLSSDIAAIPKPIYALSHRLLAYAAAPLHHRSPTLSSSRTPRTAPHSVLDDGNLKFPLTQAELGMAALRVGGTLFSGMKAIGGRAYSAARAGVSAAMSADYGSSATVTPAPGTFFSRSAPEASTRGRERRSSTPSDAGSQNGSAAGDLPQLISPPDHPTTKDGSYYVAVLDLEPLCSNASTPSTPVVLSQYMVSKHQPISELTFSEDGTSLAVALKDGRAMRVYRLRPSPKEFRNQAAAEDKTSYDDNESPPPWHIYDLRRGRTPAIVEHVSWAHDARWLGVCTRKRTVHIFALNPYGGPTDEASHVKGKVMNVGEMQPLSTELSPLVRLRALKTQPNDKFSPSTVFTFLPSSTTLPSSLMPPSGLSSHPILSSSSSAPSTSPGQYSESTANYQDVLIFDPCDGTLSLRRVVVSRRSIDDLATIRAVPAAATSISLPGVGGIGRLATLPSNPVIPARQPSALSQMMERPELLGQDSVVAIWSLRRHLTWPQIKRPFQARASHGSARYVAKSDWLSQAELSTFSHSRKIVPKSIYLAHQFSFYYFNEDYHALLRSRRFDVPAQKVDVRRQVSVSALGTAMSESFISGSSVPSQSGAGGSSFDEPLASALSAELRYSNPSPPVLPMYPNGPASRSSSRTAIPIRVAAGLSDGMSEGLGRLRREIGKVRSPKHTARIGISSSVPLEFDEEDEDFLGLDPPSDIIVRSTSHEGRTPSTSSTDMVPPSVEREDDDIWQGWEAEDKQAVEEVEQFDDIGVGFMDEEWLKNTKQY